MSRQPSASPRTEQEQHLVLIRRANRDRADLGIERTAALCLATGLRKRTWQSVRLLLMGLLLCETTVSTAGEQPRLTPLPASNSSIKQVARLRGFAEPINDLAYSPSGDVLAAGGYKVIQLVDAASKEKTGSLDVSAGFVRSVAFAPDGRLLAAGSYQSVTLWDVESKRQTAVLEGHRGYVTSVAFSPDGDRLASSSDDETVRIWSVADGRMQREWEGHTEPVHAVAFSPNGELLASAGGDETRVTRGGVVRVWNIASEEEKLAVREHRRAATDVAFSPDGTLLISTSVDETVQVYDVSTGKLVRTFAGHSRPTSCVAVAPAGDLVITGCGGRARGGNEVKIWELGTGEEKATLTGHEGKLTALALSPDGGTLATASLDKTLAFWDVSPLTSSDVKPAAVPAAEKKTEANPVSDSRPADADRASPAPETKPLRAGIIGLDTSHAPAFTGALNDPDAKPDVANCRVVAAYPHGSPDIESSRSRIPQYTQQMRDEFGVEIVDSIEELLERVDVVLLETNDGRPHLEQVLPVLKAGKPVFIDKPIAGSLADAVAIFQAARHYKVPVFSSSSLRFSAGAQALRDGKIGDITGCDAYSPCSLEATHPDLFWYGIHGVETLFTVMGTGCQSVTRVSTPEIDVAVGVWENGRVGTFRGLRTGRSGYGGTAFGTKSIEPIGGYDGYRPLVVEIVNFFRTGQPPVSERETLEIYAFMEAADESKRNGGKPVSLESVLQKARQDAERRWRK